MELGQIYDSVVPVQEGVWRKSADLREDQSAMWH
jgi:hypothetical protein